MQVASQGISYRAIGTRRRLEYASGATCIINFVALHPLRSQAERATTGNVLSGASELMHQPGRDDHPAQAGSTIGTSIWQGQSKRGHRLSRKTRGERKQFRPEAHASHRADDNLQRLLQAGQKRISQRRAATVDCLGWPVRIDGEVCASFAPDPQNFNHSFTSAAPGNSKRGGRQRRPAVDRLDPGVSLLASWGLLAPYAGSLASRKDLLPGRDPLVERAALRGFLRFRKIQTSTGATAIARAATQKTGRRGPSPNPPSLARFSNSTTTSHLEDLS